MISMRLLNNNNGAVSIMTILMMLVLVTLGVFAVTSARVNYVFSNKTLEWNIMYYALEDKAEQFVMDADHMLTQAGNKEEAYQKLSGLTDIYIDCTVFMRDDGCYAEVDFASDSDKSVHLKVEIKASISDNDYLVNNSGDAPKRYTICKWAVWQEPVRSSGSQPVWDGRLE